MTKDLPRRLDAGMSDSDLDSDAWLVPPSRYLADRPPEFAAPAKPLSLYVAMRDGCRLAVDVYLPQARGAKAPPGAVPTVLSHALLPALCAAPGRHRDRAERRQVPRFLRAARLCARRGRRARHRRELRHARQLPLAGRARRLAGEIADWIVAQPWSNGVIGSTGISYLGAAARFLASTGHPGGEGGRAALCGLGHLCRPLLPRRHAAEPARADLRRAHGRARPRPPRPAAERIAYFGDPGFAGPHPVDEDADGALLREAVAEHLGNFRMPDFITEFRFRDEPPALRSRLRLRLLQPLRLSRGVRARTSRSRRSGLDGRRRLRQRRHRPFPYLPNNAGHLLLGPWDHGARANVSPLRRRGRAAIRALGRGAALLRPLSDGPRHRPAARGAGALLHHARRSLARRPGLAAGGSTRTLHLAAGGALADVPGREARSPPDVDFAVGHWRRTRARTLRRHRHARLLCRLAGRDARMLRYTSAPLSDDAEVSGHPVVDLWLSLERGRRRRASSICPRSKRTARSAT